VCGGEEGGAASATQGLASAERQSYIGNRTGYASRLSGNNFQPRPCRGFFCAHTAGAQACDKIKDLVHTGAEERT
jgi:hypothetical protein